MSKKYIHKFGIGRSVGTSFEGLTNVGAFVWPTSALAMRVKAGGNAADDTAGAGARTVTIEGFDENWEFASETVTTAGASASSATSTTFIRVFRAYVGTCGTYTGNNTGNIVIEDSGGANDHLQIDAGEGQSEHGAYSTGADEHVMLTSINILSDSTKATTVKMMIRTGADVISAPMKPARLKWFAPGIDSGAIQRFNSPYLIPPKSDIWFEGLVDSTTADIAIDFELTVTERS